MLTTIFLKKVFSYFRVVPLKTHRRCPLNATDWSILLYSEFDLSTTSIKLILFFVLSPRHFHNHYPVTAIVRVVTILLSVFLFQYISGHSYYERIQPCSRRSCPHCIASILPFRNILVMPIQEISNSVIRKKGDAVQPLLKFYTRCRFHMFGRKSLFYRCLLFHLSGCLTA